MEIVKKGTLFVFIFAVFFSSALVCYSFTGEMGSDRYAVDAAEGFLFGGEQVYLGGFPVGLSTLGEGLYVDKIGTIKTLNGSDSPLSGKNISVGDMLLSVNGKKVSSATEVGNAVTEGENQLLFTGEGGQYIITTVPVRDAVSNSLKLGLYLSDSIEGIGTLTFVRKDGNYCGLGHPVASLDSRPPALLNKGELFSCNITDIRKSSLGMPGQLCGNVNKEKAIGSLQKNTAYGIYGRLYGDEYKNRPIVTASSRVFVAPGKAHIFTSIDGGAPQAYEVEILSAALQPKIKEKGMLIRVVDKRLIEKCGGIVQGMSGSPLMQNGKLVGAVTHVLVNEPLQGYAIYADFLFDVSDGCSVASESLAAAARPLLVLDASYPCFLKNRNKNRQKTD